MLSVARRSISAFSADPTGTGVTPSRSAARARRQPAVRRDGQAGVGAAVLAGPAALAADRPDVGAVRGVLPERLGVPVVQEDRAVRRDGERDDLAEDVLVLALEL